MALSIGLAVSTAGTTPVPGGTSVTSVSQLAGDPVDDNTMPPPAKKQCTSVFASYQRRQQPKVETVTLGTVSQLIESYITFITSDEQTWVDVTKSYAHYELMKPLLEHTFCSPATSAAVERVFSQGGMFMRPHRSRLSDSTLCSLMLAKCNISFSG